MRTRLAAGLLLLPLGASAQEGEPVPVDDAAAAEEPAGPRIVEVDPGQHVVLPPGTWLYTAPDLESSRARLGRAPEEALAALDASVVAGVQALAGDFIRVGLPVRNDMPLCAGGLDLLPIEVSFWVRQGSLGQALIRPVELPGGDGTSLVLAAGLPVAAGEAGKHVLASYGAHLEASLPEEAVGVFFSLSPAKERPEADAGLPTAATVSAADGSWSVQLPKRERGSWGVQKLAASAKGTELVFNGACFTVHGLTQDAVGMVSEGGGSEGGTIGGVVGGAAMLEVPAETPLSWSSGGRAGSTAWSWWLLEDKVRQGDDGRSCTTWSPSGDKNLGPEGALSLCWPSDADMTPEERRAAMGPPPEPVVLPERNPPKKADIKGVNVPMDVLAHLAVDIHPLDPGADQAEALASLQESTVGKVKGLEQLEHYFSSQMIENPDDTDLVVMFALLYEDMGASLLDAWVPPWLSPEQQLVYRKELSLSALPQCNKAFELYSLAGERARTAAVPPRSLKTISKALDRLRPDDRTSDEARMEACFRSYNW